MGQYRDYVESPYLSHVILNFYWLSCLDQPVLTDPNKEIRYFIGNVNRLLDTQKNPAYGRHWISQPMRIEAPIQKETYKHFLPNFFLAVDTPLGGAG